ncbi:MAG: dienelactone hydrolase family protein [Bacteroidetes bacterium]|nr:dienelactone hydrolase family protein [Bacteroidota bacterium]
MSTSFHIVNRHRDLIRGDIHLPAEIENAPVVIICHGFKGFKDWGGFPYAAEHFALKGFVALRFNFSLNGIEDSFMDFTALDRFAHNTISRELDDLGDLVDAITAGGLLSESCDTSQIGLVGHSLGGGIAIVYASEDERIGAVASWAGVADFMRWGKKTRAMWRKTGRLEIENARTGQMMPMDAGMLDDLESHITRFDIPAAAARMKQPLLILHGEQDVSVSIEEGRRIAVAADDSRSRFYPIPNTDHTFGIKHPFEGATPAFKTVLKQSVRAFRDALN